ncbi:MAG: sodium:glutamate symporter [Planctomycetes bacterium]|nr:sodium:glutamate symporter [Planctomycetota bacterium]
MNITDDMVTGIMIHLCWLSALLLVGKLLRSKVRILQKLFLPASILAGFIGLILGPYIFGNFGFQIIPDDILNTWSKFPGRLINIIFACLFLGFAIPSVKAIWQRGGPQFCYGWILGMGQYVVGVGICIVLLTPVFDVPESFGCLLEIGFSGGHGTAAGMEETFRDQGFAAGADLGLMSATIGVFSAVVIGMILINIAARKGYTRIIKSPKDLPEEKIKGLIPDEKRESGMTVTIAPDAFEPLAFHLAIVGLSILLGWYALQGIQFLSAKTSLDPFRSFPLFPLAMLGGLVVQIGAMITGVAKYFDRKTFERILGFALDYLVVAAIASIKLDVFIDYFWPFMILMLIGLLWIIFVTWFIAPRLLPDAWFERAITEYGMQTGVTACGLLLLRVADPKFETPAAESFGFKQMLYEPFMGGGFITASAPIFLISYGVWQCMGFALASICTAFFIALASGWVHKPNFNN